MNQTLILSDNQPLLQSAAESCQRRGLSGIQFACSPKTSFACEALVQAGVARKWDIKAEQQALLRDFGLIISLHCRQVFPTPVVNGIRCINFHPGFNPHNRGWFPHVFSMLNGKPAGITIHEMDEEIDHGPIIYQEEIHIGPSEVSWEVYQRIIAREKLLFEEWIDKLVRRDYIPRAPSGEGNYNSKQDFDRLTEIRMDQNAPGRDFLNHLRAMTFPGYQNAWFRDENGKRWHVSLRIEPDDRQE